MDKQNEKQIINYLYECATPEQVEQYALDAAKAIAEIAPWLSASLSDDSCENYQNACEEIFKLDLTAAYPEPKDELI